MDRTPKQEKKIKFKHKLFSPNFEPESFVLVVRMEKVFWKRREENTEATWLLAFLTLL